MDKIVKNNIKELFEYLNRSIMEARKEVLIKEIASGERILLVRSAQIELFCTCLQQLKDRVDNGHILVIGKQGDEKYIEAIWGNQYTLLPIDGNYNVSKLNEYMEKIKQFKPTMYMYLNYRANDEKCINIYEIMAYITGGKVYEYMKDDTCYEILDVKKYYENMVMMLKLMSWYYGEIYE